LRKSDDSYKQASTERGERVEKEKIALFASIMQSSHVNKFNYRYHASGSFVFRVPPIIISNGSTAATARAAKNLIIAIFMVLFKSDLYL
jgi:hypothetical protein